VCRKRTDLKWVGFLSAGREHVSSSSLCARIVVANERLGSSGPRFAEYFTNFSQVCTPLHFSRDFREQKSSGVICTEQREFVCLCINVCLCEKKRSFTYHKNSDEFFPHLRLNKSLRRRNTMCKRIQVRVNYINIL